MKQTRSKKLGQCFLEDRNILQKQAKLADITGKRVLEIGGGDGRLTQELLNQKPEKLFVVEKDEKFVGVLKERFRTDKRVAVINGDFLKIKMPKVDVIIGNIPYYISSDIIFRLKDLEFIHAIIMVQKEFGEKMVAKPTEKNYGRLSVTSQLYFDVKVIQKVPKHVFKPKPKVDSVIIMLKPKGARLSRFQEDIIRYLFQHRNKTVRNALLDCKKFRKENIEKLGEMRKRRVRTLTKQECLAIADKIKHYSENSSAS